jgi:hypothetical protein
MEKGIECQKQTNVNRRDVIHRQKGKRQKKTAQNQLADAPAKTGGLD